MIKELLNILRGEDPNEAISSRLSQMMELAEGLVVEGGNCLFQGCAEVDRDAFFERDQEINSLQQEIRTHMVGRLALSTSMERARFMVIFGLIKDIERLGDYAKNLLGVAELLDAAFPECGETEELRRIRAEVEASLREARTLLKDADTVGARTQMARGQEVAQRCERLVVQITRSNLPTATAVPLALAARHYKRIQKHLTNALSTLVMPLHKIDYIE